MSYLSLKPSGAFLISANYTDGLGQGLKYLHYYENEIPQAYGKRWIMYYVFLFCIPIAKLQYLDYYWTEDTTALH